MQDWSIAHPNIFRKFLLKSLAFLLNTLFQIYNYSIKLLIYQKMYCLQSVSFPGTFDKLFWIEYPVVFLYAIFGKLIGIFLLQHLKALSCFLLINCPIFLTFKKQNAVFKMYGGFAYCNISKSNIHIVSDCLWYRFPKPILYL